jgi:hypothetical protein
MPDRSRKRPRDLNVLASHIVGKAVCEEKPDSQEHAKTPQPRAWPTRRAQGRYRYRRLSCKGLSKR